MKKLLLLFCLLTSLAHGQTNLPLNLSPTPVRLYPTSPASLSAAYTATGSSLTLTVVATYGPGERPLPTVDQPAIQVLSDRYILNWSSTQTARQPDQVWLEIRAATTVIRAGYISFERSTLPIPSGSLAAITIANITLADIVPLNTGISSLTAAMALRLLTTDFSSYSATTTSAIAANAGNINTHTGQIAGLTSATATLNSTAATNAANIATHTTQIAGLVSATATLSNTAAINVANIAGLASATATINSNVATNTGSISTHTGQIAGLQSATATLSSTAATNAGNISTHTGQIAGLVSATATLNSTAATNGANIATHTAQIAGLASATATLNSTAITNVANIAGLASATATLNSTASTNAGNINTHTGQIAGLVSATAAIDSRITTNTNSITLTSAVLGSYKNVLLSGVKGDGTTDDTQAIQTLLNAGGTLFFPGNYTYIASNLTVKSNTRLIRGAGAVLRFKTGSSGYMLNLTAAENVQIEGMQIEGSTSMTGYKTNPTIGTRGGVLLDVTKNKNTITGCSIVGFDGVGVGYTGNSSSINESVRIANNSISYNYCGITTTASGTAITNFSSLTSGNGGEYSVISANTINFNRYGVIASAGNTNVTGNNMTNNGYGIYMATTGNVGHGNIVGNLINHSQVNTIYMSQNNVSHVITGNHFYDGDLFFDNCDQITFTSNVVYATNLTINGSGFHNLSNNVFNLTPTISGSYTNVYFGNNWDKTAGAYIINNSLIVNSDISYSLISQIKGAQLIANGDFSSATGWTSGAGWSIAGGVATATSAGGFLTRTASFSINVEYVIQFDISNYTSGGITVGIGGQGVSASQSGNGTKIVYYTRPASGDNTLYFYPPSGFSGNIDNVSIYARNTKKSLTVANEIVVGTITTSTGVFAGPGAVNNGRDVGQFGGSISYKPASGAANPTTTDITTGNCVLWTNTANSTTKLFCNIGGTIVSTPALSSANN